MACKLFACFLLLLLASLHPSILIRRAAGLKQDYYDDSCPSVEVLVQASVAQAVARNPGVAAGLLRLHFHDCFVRGCDGSVLLDSTPENKAEKDAIQNFGLRGFEVIDSAKSKLESRCPGTVSCADILAFAARDAVSQVGGPHWEVPAGRRDGLVSRQDEPGSNLPSPLFNVAQLTENFVRKGMSQDDMITLSGAHTIGQAHCLSFVNRLYNFSASSVQDPSLDTNLAGKLKALCPKDSNFTDPKSKAIPLDGLTPNLFDSGYYATLGRRKGILTSDNILFLDSGTTKSVEANVEDEANWRSDFVDAMVRLGSIQVLTGSQGQIRRNCRLVNKN